LAANICFEMESVLSSSDRATIVARLTTDAATAARLHNALAECCDGESVSVSIAEEKGGWSLALHFRDRPDESAIRALVTSVAGPAAGRGLRFEALASTDWVRASLEGLKPVEAGRFVVHGAHDRGRIGINRIAIEIEAGLAFGTGHHGSTRGCLLALDRITKARRRTRGAAGTTPGLRGAVLDIGTGTGVLAIAAAKALRRPVIAGDIDPRAVATARANTRINRVARDVRVVHGAGAADRRLRERAPYAVIFANILLDPLKGIATPIARLTAPNGWVVLSGLLNAQAAAATASYRARGLALAQRIVLAGWTTLILARRSHVTRALPRRRTLHRLPPCSKPASSRSRIRPSGPQARHALPRCAQSSRAVD
jgi:ribosomal protein L11 methyltransferase